MRGQKRVFFAIQTITGAIPGMGSINKMKRSIAGPFVESDSRVFVRNAGSVNEDEEDERGGGEDMLNQKLQK
jgi:hypothetical protein